MKLLHFADLHLDAPFLWADQRVAEQRRQALRDTLVAILELAQRLGVDALLCGGDLYDQDRVTPDTAQFLRAAFERAEPLRIFVSPGNHDWSGPRSLLPWSANVTIFRGSTLEPVTLLDGLTLWGAAHAAPAGTGGFLDGFRVDRGGIHLGLFHGSLRGRHQWAAEDRDPHAPFTELQIVQAGLHHALLGHYHVPLDGGRLTYPGNPDPLTFGETGPRGAVLVTVSAEGTVRTERHTVAQTQVHDILIDLTGCVSAQDVRDRLLQALVSISGCVRATLCGTVSPDVEIRPANLARVAPHLDALVVRSIEVRRAYDVEAILLEPTVRGEFVRDVQGAELPEADRLRVLTMGLRALAGQPDLEER